jgi:hypothetical protein
VIAGSCAAWFFLPALNTFQRGPLSHTDLGLRTIESVGIGITLAPEAGLSATATLVLVPKEHAPSSLTLLLNRELTVTSAETESGRLEVQRQGDLMALSGAGLAGASQVRIAYEGRPTISGKSSGACWSDDTVILPPLSYWYPMDLHSFHSLEGSVQLARDSAATGGRFVTGGRYLTEAMDDAGLRHRWRTTRPVLGGTLAWGAYDSRDAVYGQMSVTVCGAAETIARTPGVSDTVRDVNGYLSSRYGESGFNQLRMIIDPAVGRGWNGWDGVMAVSPDALRGDPDRTLVRLGHLVAENWWGATLTGRWFSDRPEGSAWLRYGLSEYSAWRALRNLSGRTAYIRYLESLPCVGSDVVPLEQLNLGDPERINREGAIRGAFAALAIAEYVGAEDFDSACRNALAIHRYSPVSYAAFMHEHRLASGKDLDELFLAWFHRRAPFDYALDNVAIAGQRVQMTVENRGNLPAWPEMEVAIVGDRGVAMKSTGARPPRTVVDFETNVRTRRVVLDPGFATPDHARANNVWPRMVWPVSLEVSETPGVVVASKSEWCLDTPDTRAWWAPAAPADLRAIPSTPGAGGGVESAELAAVIADWRAAGKMSDGEDDTLKAFDPVSNVVYVAETDDVLFFDRSGRYIRMRPPEDPAASAPETTAVLNLPYEVNRARLSRSGDFAAWIDRAGLLRVTHVREPFPRYTSVQGEVLDFRWHEDGSLYALAAASPRLLPTRFHATYSLWRVNSETWDSEQVMEELEYRFAEAGQ